MRLWSTVVSQLHTPLVGYSSTCGTAGAAAAVAMLDVLRFRLFQRLQICDDIRDLLIAESDGERDLRDRIVLSLAQRRHEDTRLHLPRVLHPAREMRRVIRIETARDRQTAAH